jgi:predicted transcriptional regulator
MATSIKQYIDREDRREILKQDAQRAWSAYEADGRHLTMEEADAWLARLEGGEDVEPPACHD